MENEGPSQGEYTNLWDEAQRHARIYDAETGIIHLNPKAAPDHTITQEELQTKFDDALSMWQASTCRRELLDMHDRMQTRTGWHFDKVVCLATGCFHRQDADLTLRGLLQLACVVDIADELKKRGHGAAGRIQIIAQDPSYTEKDKELLSSKGVSVLAVDRNADMSLKPASDYMDAHTLVFEFRIDMHEEVVMELYGTGVGMHIGTGSSFLHDPRHCFDLNGLADWFEMTHDSCDFPRFEEQPGVFERLKIQWRKRRV